MMTDSEGLSCLLPFPEGARPEEYSPLCLAFLGDAVFELLIRTVVTGEGNMPVHKMSQKSRKFVNASAQSRFYSTLEGVVTTEEEAVLKRGRNAKSYSQAKNANVLDYRRATGVEALFGYLYMKGRYDRINTLFSLLFHNNDDVSVIKEDEGNGD